MGRLTPSEKRRQEAEASVLRAQVKQSRPAPMKPPAGWNEAPYRELPDYEQRLVLDPRMVSYGAVADLLVAKWEAAQPGVKPGTGQEDAILAEMDARREESLQAERNHKRGLRRGAHFVSGRIRDGRWVEVFKLPAVDRDGTVRPGRGPYVEV